VKRDESRGDTGAHRDPKVLRYICSMLICNICLIDSELLHGVGGDGSGVLSGWPGCVPKERYESFGFTGCRLSVRSTILLMFAILL
jgi:hypothetical protein